MPSVIETADRFARLVARATPTGFRVIEQTCDLLESEVAGVEVGEVAQDVVATTREGRAIAAIVALRAACRTRRAIRGK